MKKNIGLIVGQADKKSILKSNKQPIQDIITDHLITYYNNQWKNRNIHLEIYSQQSITHLNIQIPQQSLILKNLNLHTHLINCITNKIEISISQCFISSSNILQLITLNPHLQTLCICSDQLNQLELDFQVFQAISTLNQLQILQIDSKFLDLKSIKEISKIANLKLLDLGTSFKAKKGLKTCPKIIAQYLPKLQMLILPGKLISHSAKRLLKLKNLKYLDLQKNKLTEQQIISIINMKWLKCLLLSYNYVTYKGVQMISGMKGLNGLALESCNILDQHVYLISQLSELTELNLAKNHITIRGTKNIACKLIKLKYLNLKSNNLSKQAIDMLYNEYPLLTYKKNLDIHSCIVPQYEIKRYKTRKQYWRLCRHHLICESTNYNLYFSKKIIDLF